MNNNLQVSGEDYIAGFLTNDRGRTKTRLVTEKCTDWYILLLSVNLYGTIRWDRIWNCVGPHMAELRWTA